MRIDPSLPVSEIARRWPATLPVLARHKIDLCCGGVHPLEFVCEKHALDLPTVVRELEEATRTPAKAAP